MGLYNYNNRGSSANYKIEIVYLPQFVCFVFVSAVAKRDKMSERFNNVHKST